MQIYESERVNEFSGRNKKQRGKESSNFNSSKKVVPLRLAQVKTRDEKR